MFLLTAGELPSTTPAVGLSEGQPSATSPRSRKRPDWVREFRLKALTSSTKKPMAHHWASQGSGGDRFRQDPLQKINSCSKGGPPPAPPSAAAGTKCRTTVKQTFEGPRDPRAVSASSLARREASGSTSEAALLPHEGRDWVKEGVIFVRPPRGPRQYTAKFSAPTSTPKVYSRLPNNTRSCLSALATSPRRLLRAASFIYVPKGVKLKQPLQAYFRINAENFGQFERTLIIADEAPRSPTWRAAPPRSSETRHPPQRGRRTGPRSRAPRSSTSPSKTGRTTSSNLVTKRGMADEGAEVKWIDCNIGSRLTMKVPRTSS